jgi:hypothetical protein
VATTQKFKCFQVCDGESCQYIIHKTAGKARYYAYSHWYHNEYSLTDFTVRRFPAGDAHAATFTRPIELQDEKLLRSLGVNYMCPDCNSEYLIGDGCPQCQPT